MEVPLARGRWTVAGIAWGVAMHLFAPERAAAQKTCLMDARQARIHTQVINNQFTDPDPQWRLRLGLPDTIQSITWSQEAAVCVEALEHLQVVGDSLGWHGYP